MIKSKNEEFLKHEVRNLPISECYISANWETVGTTWVLVVRRQDNGKFAVASYLIDRWCLGLRDSIYGIHMGPDFVEEAKHSIQNPVLIDYPTAHNIIFGAIRYADSIGFKPHNSWRKSQYVLEREDSVERQALEFGKDGRPIFAPAKDESPIFIKHILERLNKKIGRKSYLYVPSYSNPTYKEVLPDDTPLFDLILTEKEQEQIQLPWLYPPSSNSSSYFTTYFSAGSRKKTRSRG